MMRLNFGSLTRPVLVACLAVATLATSGFAGVSVDPNVPVYKRISGISGNVSSVGSDTLLNLMTLWAEEFNKLYPNVKIQIEGKGSSTAPPALISGTAQFGPMSRMMKNKELDAFEKKFGYKPTTFRVAVDALAVFVNKDNPIKGMSLAEVDASFSKTRKRGHTDIKTWDQLGLKGEWAGKPISLYGRNSASGTYGYFKHVSMKKGDYKDTVKEQPGSASVVQGITSDRYGLGYSGIGYTTPGVRAVAISEKAGGKAVPANAENALSGEYPLARFLYININKAPNKPIDPLTKEFLRLVLSKVGQGVVIKDGYFPLPAAAIEQELKKLD